MRLGVNIDHIATLRQARREIFPDPIEAAKEVIAGGAEGIVCHLREDRRHIQDEDVYQLRKLPTRLDLEMALTEEMIAIACKLKPNMVTLVPEKREEITTEGGLDVASFESQVASQIKDLQKAGIAVSLFIDPEAKQIKVAANTGAEFIEIHTGKYARNPSAANLKEIEDAVKLAKSLGLRVNAGHGLDYNNVREIVKIKEIEELNIGFSIIARSIFAGLRQAVKEMKDLCA